MDYFQHPALIPAQIQTIIDSLDQDADPYTECLRLEAEMAPYGWGFEWGLDGEPFNLHQITLIEASESALLELSKWAETYPEDEDLPRVIQRLTAALQSARP